MFVFRFEHNRNVCGNSFYSNSGDSLTGHGTFTYCPTKNNRTSPAFGFRGSPPDGIMPHLRCAVTAQQFSAWADFTYDCDGTCGAADCECPYTYENGYRCLEDCKYQACTCPPKGCPVWGDDWQLVAYWVEDGSDGIDWYESRNQIVFNPEFAINMGEVTLDDVEAFGGSRYASAGF